MKYLIGEFSRLMGVSIDTLKHYESLKIIQPLKDEQNNYRYFSDYDAREIIKSRILRSLNLNLNDITNLMNSDSPLPITEKLEESKKALQEQVRRNTLLIKKIDEYLRDIADLDSFIGKFTVQSLPGLYRLQHTNKDELLKNPAIEKIVSSWMDALPFTFPSFKVNAKEFFDGVTEYNYNWGQAIWENELAHTELEINDFVEFIPPQVYLTIILSGMDDDYFLSGARTLIRNYLQENEYLVTGDILGRLIHTQKKSKQNIYYVKVLIPIQTIRSCNTPT